MMQSGDMISNKSWIFGYEIYSYFLECGYTFIIANIKQYLTFIAYPTSFL